MNSKIGKNFQKTGPGFRPAREVPLCPQNELLLSYFGGTRHPKNGPKNSPVFFFPPNPELKPRKVYTTVQPSRASPPAELVLSSARHTSSHRSGGANDRTTFSMIPHFRELQWGPLLRPLVHLPHCIHCTGARQQLRRRLRRPQHCDAQPNHERVCPGTPSSLLEVR